MERTKSSKPQVSENKKPTVTITRNTTVIDPLPIKNAEQVEVELVAPKIEAATRLKLRYRKVGGGSLSILGKTFKYNDVFEAYPEDIPKAFRNVVSCLSTEAEIKQSVAEGKGIFDKEILYKVVPSILSGSFNVINSETKKQINEKQLNKADAERLCNSLNI